MLHIEKKVEGSRAYISLEGRLDKLSSPTLERELEPMLAGITELELDLAKLEYISSAGLRVLLEAAQAMEEQGTMKVAHVTAEVMDTFRLTGFDDILTIEP